MINLRNYQFDGVKSVSNKFAKKIKRIVYVLSTGGGKTVIFTYLTWKSSQKGKKVLILVHRIELLKQVSKALKKFNVEHGIINAKFKPDFSKNVQVATIDTIINKLNYLKIINWEADFIIADECHHTNAKTWTTVINNFVDAYLLGVTATPVRGDGQGLGVDSGGLFLDMVKGPPMSWLQEEGFLVYAKVFGTPEKIDVSNVNISKSNGDYQREELAKVMNKATITGDAVDHYKEICENHYGYNAPAIVFTVNVDHAKRVAEQFRKEGYRFYSVDGNSEDEYRERVLAGLEDGTVEGVVSCDIISEGTDIPKATVEIDLRPTRSKGRKIQNDGRVLRPVYADGYDLETKEGRLAAIAASEKPYAIILDHVNNTERIGCFSWDDHQWSLEGQPKRKGKRKNEQPPVKIAMCENCYMHQEPAVICAGCGQIMKAPRDATPKQVEGKLREITEVRAQEKQQQGMSKTLEDLQRFGASKGYAPGWAERVFKAREAKKVKPVSGIKGLFNNKLEF